MLLSKLSQQGSKIIIKPIDYVQYANLSPFELKDNLIKQVQSHTDRIMLNAFRGNSKFIAAQSRQYFFQLGFFASAEFEISYYYLNGCLKSSVCTTPIRMIAA